MSLIFFILQQNYNTILYNTLQYNTIHITIHSAIIRQQVFVLYNVHCTHLSLIT